MELMELMELMEPWCISTFTTLYLLSMAPNKQGHRGRRPKSNHRQLIAKINKKYNIWGNDGLVGSAFRFGPLDHAYHIVLSPAIIGFGPPR